MNITNENAMYELAIIHMAEWEHLESRGQYRSVRNAVEFFAALLTEKMYILSLMYKHATECNTILATLTGDIRFINYYLQWSKEKMI